MSELLVVVSFALVVALVVTNLYWRRQLRTVASGVETAREWDASVGETEATSDDLHQYVELAVERIDGQPSDLPDEIDRLEETVDDLRQRQETLREAWIESWFEARERDAVDFDAPQVLTLAVPAGSSETVKAFAREFLDCRDAIGIVTSGEDGSFAVGVGESAAEAFPANDVASRVAETAGGGGSGGSERLAVGGGASAEAIADAAVTVAEDIRDER